MPSVLTISSQVAAGPVGNSAIVPALLSLGVTPLAVPTVVLSFHPGHAPPRGMALPAEVLASVLSALADNGFLAGCRCVLTGFFAGAEQVEAAADTVSRMKADGAIVLCDPVIGDDDALYVKAEVAAAIRDRLVPLADILLPNVFELGWLAGRAVTDVASAGEAATVFAGKQVIATSVPGETAGEIATVLFGDGAPLIVSRPRLPAVPHGTGDLLSGLVAGHVALGRRPRDRLREAVDQLETAIAASDGLVLNLAEVLRA